MKFVIDLSKGVLGTPDSPVLWNQILSNVPDSLLLKPDFRCLVVACGHCTEAVLLVKRMQSLGIPDSRIQDAIWVLDKYPVFTNQARKYGFKNIITADFLAWDSKGMKFDLVMGNPPYQSEKRTGTQPLWSLFVYKGIQLLNNSGYFAFIVPNKWLGHTTNVVKGKVHFYRDIFKGNLISVNSQECSKWFPGIGNTGEMFSYFVGTLKGSDQFQFQNKEGVYTIDKNDFEYLPLRLPTKITSSILRKVKTDESYQFKQSIYSKNTNSYSIVINGAQRLIPSRTEIFLDCSENKISRNMKPTISRISFRYSNQKIVDSVFRSKLFKFIFDIYWNGDTLYTTFFNSLPYVDLSRTWTDQELYAHFGLTQEEIDYIEEQVK